VARTGDVLDAGDRRLLLIVPPIFAGPTTRALFDERTSVLCSVDSFAAMTPGALFGRPCPAQRAERAT